MQSDLPNFQTNPPQRNSEARTLDVWRFRVEESIKDDDNKHTNKVKARLYSSPSGGKGPKDYIIEIAAPGSKAVGDFIYAVRPEGGTDTKHKIAGDEERNVVWTEIPYCPLPSGVQKYRVLMITNDATDPPTRGWDFPKFH